MKRPRKIALVDLSHIFTGGQTYMKSLVTLLSGDAQLWLVKLSPELNVGTANGVKTIDLGFALKRSRALHIPLTMVVLAWLRVTQGIDTVWVNGYPEIALMPWARMMGCRAIATRHLTLVTDRPKFHWIKSGWRVHFVYEVLAPTAQKIICVSEAVAESLRTRVRSEKLAVIQNWIPTLPVPVTPTSDEATPLRLLFVGRMVRYKGAYLILDAMRRLKAVAGLRGVSLTIVGSGDDLESLKAEAKDLNVEFAGFHADPSPFYRRTDVFVNPTLGPEGLPLVSLDAMSYGLPCIFSDLPVHKEITDGGRSALLFESGSPEDLKRAIEEFLRAPELLEKYGRLARAYVEAKHTPEFARQRYIEEIAL